MNRSSLALRASVVLGSALLGAPGCTVGPEYAQPDLSSQFPDSWSTPEAQASTAQVAEWWTLLDDDELSDLIDRAVGGNLDLAQARERIVTARARRGIANADRFPTLDAQASYQRSQTGDEGLVLGGAPSGVGVDVYSLGAVAGWELDLWGRVARLTEAADADIAFALEDFRAAKVALAAEVARELVTARSLRRDLGLVRSSNASDQDALDIARARADAGFANELDAARAARVLESNRALLPMLRADLRESQFRLSLLLGEQSGSVVVGDGELPRRDVIPALGVPADLLLRRPDLRRAEQELIAATARIGAAEAERLPRVSLSGSIALQGPNLDDTVNPDAYILQAGPTITLPIFQGGRIKSRIMQAESEQRVAILGLRAAALSAMSEVETAAMRRSHAEDRVASLLGAEAAANSAETLSLDRYTAGAVDFLDVTEARTQRLAIERSRVIAERDATLRLIDLYAALGGGWSGADEVALAETQSQD